MRPISLLAVIVLVVALPAVAAHGITQTLPVETHLLLDEAEDAFLVIDGYDLYDLYVRETYWPAHGEGLTFRFSLWGGFAAASTADALHIEIGATGSSEWSARLSTSNDVDWTIEGATLIEAAVEPDISGYATQMQVFVPYDALGLGVGDSVTDVWMRSYVDDRLIDVAPGGLAVGPTEVPTDSQVLNATIARQGPIGYVRFIAGTFDENQLRVVIQNAFPDDGQHLGIESDGGAGWVHEPLPTTHTTVEGGRNATFSIDFQTAGASPLEFAVTTDLGGRLPFYVTQSDGQWHVHIDAPAAVPPVGEAVSTAPLGGVGLLAVALALGALVSRRTR